MKSSIVHEKKRFKSWNCHFRWKCVSLRENVSIRVCLLYITPITNPALWATQPRGARNQRLWVQCFYSLIAEFFLHGIYDCDNFFSNDIFCLKRPRYRWKNIGPIILGSWGTVAHQTVCKNPTRLWIWTSQIKHWGFNWLNIQNFQMAFNLYLQSLLFEFVVSCTRVTFVH